MKSIKNTGNLKVLPRKAGSNNMKLPLYPTTQLPNYLTTSRSAQIIILPLIFLVVVMILTITMFSRVGIFLRSNATSVQNEQAVAVAEAGIDHALFKLNNTVLPYSGEIVNFVPQKEQFSTTIDPPGVGVTEKKITSEGCIPNCTSPKAKRTVKVTVINNSGFNYALHTAGGSPGGSRDGLEFIGGAIPSQIHYQIRFLPPPHLQTAEYTARYTIKIN